MPSNLSGLLLFVALLAPGFVYHSRREALRASAELTTLREAGTIVLTSLVFNAIAAGVFFAIHRLADVGPSVQLLVDDTAGYARREWRALTAWGGGLLAFSCLLAAQVARPTARVRHIVEATFGRQGDFGNWLRLTEIAPAWPISAWQSVFIEHAPGGGFPMVEVRLVDGTVVSGRHVSHTAQIEEDSDRSIVLGPPLHARHPGDPNRDLLAVERLVVAADQISYLTVTYMLEPAGGLDD